MNFLCNAPADLSIQIQKNFTVTALKKEPNENSYDD